MMTNIVPTSTFMTSSNVSYRLNQTNRNPNIPARTAQTRSEISGNSAVRGSAVALIAVAP